MPGGFGAPTRPSYALTQEEVREGMTFHTYRLGEQGSDRRGEFLSGVYISDDPCHNQGLVVDVRWHDGRKTTEVASELGLCHDRYTGQFGDGISLPDEE